VTKHSSVLDPVKGWFDLPSPRKYETIISASDLAECGALGAAADRNNLGYLSAGLYHSHCKYVICCARRTC
jgi:hypothetical protein